MFKHYKVIYEIIEKKNSKPIRKTYQFSCDNGKRHAWKIANEILCDYILDNNFYVGSIKKIMELKM